MTCCLLSRGSQVRVLPSLPQTKGFRSEAHPEKRDSGSLSGGIPAAAVDFYILLRFPYTASLIFSRQWISRLFRLSKTALGGWKTAKVGRKIPSGVHASFGGAA